MPKLSVVTGSLIQVKHTYVLGLGGVVLLVSCMAPPTATSPPVSAPGSSSSDALATLSHLPIKGRAPMTGYARAQFGESWTDDNDDVWGHNRCDTRDDILRRDLREVVLRPGGCQVAGGTLSDPYTGTDVPFTRGERTSALIQIDHLVSVVMTRFVVVCAGQAVADMSLTHGGLRLRRSKIG